jgi:hypothetical protein
MVLERASHAWLIDGLPHMGRYYPPFALVQNSEAPARTLEPKSFKAVLTLSETRLKAIAFGSNVKSD